jgi:hypothetical protein
MNGMPEEPLKNYYLILVEIIGFMDDFTSIRYV